MLLNHYECTKLTGKGFTPGTLFLYLAITALGAAIIKILFSSRGRVSFGGLNMTWGN